LGCAYIHKIYVKIEKKRKKRQEQSQLAVLDGRLLAMSPPSCSSVPRFSTSSPSLFLPSLCGSPLLFRLLCLLSRISSSSSLTSPHLPLSCLLLFLSCVFSSSPSHASTFSSSSRPFSAWFPTSSTSSSHTSAASSLSRPSISLLSPTPPPLVAPCRKPVNYLIRQLLLSTHLISAYRLQMLLFPLHFLGGCSE